MHWLLFADSPAPAFDFIYWTSILARVAHTLAAATLLGGLVFLRQVVGPVADGADDRDEVLYRGQRDVWSRLVMLATAFLLASGFYNLYVILAANEKVPSAYHILFSVKFLLAMFVFFVAAATAGKSPLAVRMRLRINWWLNLCLAALVAIFILGAMMRSFPKIPKPELNPVAMHLVSETSQSNG